MWKIIETEVRGFIIGALFRGLSMSYKNRLGYCFVTQYFEKDVPQYRHHHSFGLYAKYTR